MNRRAFLCSTALGALACARIANGAASKSKSKPRELRINRVIIQDAVGRRLTPVAPNAYAAYRGYEVKEPILRIQSSQGLEGIARASIPPDVLRELLGCDPFKLFTWDSDRISGPAEEYRALMDRLKGADVALLDLLGKALQLPAWSLLGKSVRKKIPVYDSSLYMEDLLKPEQLQDLAYLNGRPVPSDPVELVALKARWVIRDRPEGFQSVKIKIGRVKWMPSFEAALERDIAVTQAVRAAVGPGIRVTVDGNKGFEKNKDAVASYASGVSSAKVYFMEEMFSETDTVAMRDLKSRLRAAGNPVKLAAGESFPGGIPENVYRERFQGAGGEKRHEEPLIDIEQADMNAHGFLKLRAKAAIQDKLGMTLAPHNFGSKMGFYAQLHLARCVPNWETAETDDSQFPALIPHGITVERGIARLTDAPGLGVHLQEKELKKPSFDESD